MRARNIKPDFFRDYDLCRMDIYARVLFAGLWCLADREGRLEDCPPRIQADVFPWDDVEIEKLLESLAENGFIVRYKAYDGQKKDCRPYIQVANFSKHQNPHKNEKPSVIPGVEKAQVITGQARVITGANRADSLIPDSLIPDSLIPDSLIPDSVAPPTPPGGDDNSRGGVVELPTRGNFSLMAKLYRGMYAKDPPPMIWEKLRQISAQYPEEKLREAAQKTAEGNGKTLDYFLSILNGESKPRPAAKTKDEIRREKNREAARRFAEGGSG